MAIQFKTAPVKEEVPVTEEVEPVNGTVCGGTAPNAMQVQEKAVIKAMEQLSEHPCGCEVCFSNIVLWNLRKFREEAGLDPATGNMME